MDANKYLLLQLLIYHMDIEIAHVDEIVCDLRERVGKCRDRIIMYDAMIDRNKQGIARLNRAYGFPVGSDAHADRIALRSEVERRHIQRRDAESDRSLKLDRQISRASKDIKELRDAKGHLITLLTSA
jgi:SMC interacting uncharacterized protein involved in chromosome segregation